ncbi:hypothetical protein LOD99_6304 [Oopsacas minuta]|uniref:C2H2-type domain-containing protein n=1 Tax=Oopsacas minuta TaxID=111878 RepID=A0AAV7JNG8_9METZ|nr:hypothetical protein LOD99_6304 [Oopsacas minuta]
MGQVSVCIIRSQEVSSDFSELHCQTTGKVQKSQRKVRDRNGGNFDFETGEGGNSSGEKANERGNCSTTGKINSLRKPSQPNIQSQQSMKKTFSISYSTRSPNFQNTISKDLVRCQICNNLVNYRKYRRHLRVHLRKGLISADNLEEISFGTKFSRKDKLDKNKSIIKGNICYLCGSSVQDLSTHIIRVHDINRGDEKFEEILLNSKPCERMSHFHNHTQTNYNPLFKYKNLPPCLHPDMIPKIIHQSTVSNIDAPNSLNSSLSDFPSDEEDTDILLDTRDIFNIQRLKNLISEHFFLAVQGYAKFITTSWGGSKSEKSVNIDIANICRIINSVGEKQFFDVNSINNYITKESKSGKAPITVHSRVRSLFRFTDYLRNHENNILPSPDFERLQSMLKGVEKSLVRQRNKRMKSVMSVNRNNFEHTTQVVQKWRNRRHKYEHMDLFESYTNSSNPLSKDSYCRMRNYLICEIIIPNGQRAGIISGMLIQEVEKARSLDDSEHFQIHVANHKTGHIQCASIFLYPSTFRALKIFTQIILPKLEIYSSGKSNLGPYSPVFQTFEGKKCGELLVTPFIRRCLKDMEIQYFGTVTDFRRAAASLTGKHKPHLAEAMSLFLGHSRRAHDKYYRIQFGHFGLIDAFIELEKLQTDPFIEKSVLVSDVSDPTVALLTTSLDSSNVSNCPTLNPQDDLLCDPLSPTISEFTTNSTILSPLIHPVSDYQTETIISQLNHSCSNVSPLNNSLLDGDRMSIVSELASSCPSAVSLHSETFTSPEHSPFIASSPKVQDSVLDASMNRHQSQQDSDKSVLDSENSFVRSDRIFLKEFSIQIPQLNIRTLQSAKSTNSSLTNHVCINDMRNIRKSLFSLKSDETLFFNVFQKFITRVEDHLPVSKAEVIHKANSTSEFVPVLLRLKSRHTGDVYQKIYAKIRTVGNVLKSCNGNNSSNLTPSTKSRLESTFETGHHKSIFLLRKDENIFFSVFSDMITRISERKIVRKIEILDRAYSSAEFSPLIDKLHSSSSLSAIDKRIFNKVHSMGYALRKQH